MSKSKMLGVIPARYASTRFSGKGLIELDCK
jgi:CMP-2-keto-3-deoxyoctulosonic acid synthetase